MLVAIKGINEYFKCIDGGLTIYKVKNVTLVYSIINSKNQVPDKE